MLTLIKLPALLLSSILLVVAYLIDGLQTRSIRPQTDTFDATAVVQQNKSDATRSAKSLPASVSRNKLFSMRSQPAFSN